MRCPHCKVDFHNEATHIVLGNDIEGGWKIVNIKCTSCKKFVIYLKKGKITTYIPTGKGDSYLPQQNINAEKQMKLDFMLPQKVFDVSGENIEDEIKYIQDQDVTLNILVRPKVGMRPPCPAEVPANIAENYNEACLVLADSPKASAALSRRCLQHLLEEVVKIKPGELASEIQQVLDRENLPSHIAEAVDAIRNIGNFAAHPMKSQKSGEVLPVEPEEAEWNLDVLEALFDFYCVQPAILQRKKDALNKKLQEAGKKPMK